MLGLDLHALTLGVLEVLDCVKIASAFEVPLHTHDGAGTGGHFCDRGEIHLFPDSDFRALPTIRSRRDDRLHTFALRSGWRHDHLPSTTSYAVLSGGGVPFSTQAAR